MGFPGGSAGKESACNAGDLGLIPGLGRYPEENYSPLQYSGLETSMDCSPPFSSVHGDSPDQNTGVGSRSFLQGIFPTQGSNPGLPHCRWIHYHLSHQGNPKNTGVGNLSLLQGIFPTQESNRGLLHCRQILYQLSYQRSLVEGLVMVKSSLSPCKALAFAWGPEKGELFP